MALLEPQLSQQILASTALADAGLELDAATLDRIADEMAATPALCAPRPAVALPVRFDSVEAELNFYAVAALAQGITVGYDQAAQEELQRSASEAALFGVMGLHISGSPLDAAALADLSLSEISSAFQLPLVTEKGKQLMPGVEELQHHPLRALAMSLQTAFHETASQLVSRTAHRSLGGFILEVTKPRSGEPASAARLVAALTTTFPHFQTTYKIGAEEIPLRLAAADLASILQQRFGEAEPQRFAFADRGVLPCAADDRAFAALVTHGVLTPKEGAPQEAPPTGLKLAAVHAAIGSLRDRVVARNGPMTAYSVDMLPGFYRLKGIVN